MAAICALKSSKACEGAGAAVLAVAARVNMAVNEKADVVEAAMRTKNMVVVVVLVL